MTIFRINLIRSFNLLNISLKEEHIFLYYQIKILKNEYISHLSELFFYNIILIANLKYQKISILSI